MIGHHIILMPTSMWQRLLGDPETQEAGMMVRALVGNIAQRPRLNHRSIYERINR